jgi:hypothetical protein
MTNVAGETAGFVQRALTSLADQVYNILPTVLGLFILLVAGYIVGFIIKRIVLRLLASMRIDEWLEEQNLSDAIAGRTVSNIIAGIFQWSIILLFLAQGAALMQYEVLKSTLQGLVYFVYLFILAILIGLAGLIIARYVRNILEVSMTRFRKIIGIAAELLILYMAVVMALKVIPTIDTTILEYAFIIGFGSIAFAGALAIGLGFGLAFKDEAKAMLKEWETPKKRKK